MDIDKISDSIKKLDLHTIVRQYTPKVLADNLSFDEGRILAYKLSCNEELDNDLRYYATELLQELRQIYPNEWSADWKNDVFLGDACYLTMKEEERYEAYKRAYEKARPPPPSLLLSLAGCYHSCKPTITVDEAEKLVLSALEQEMSLRGIVLLRGIYARKNDQVKFDYWDKIFREVEQKNLHSKDDTWPDILPKDTQPKAS